MDLERTTRRRGAELERAILDASWQQLIEGGYPGFTIDAVAERAGTSRSVIYRRWADRGALVEAALAHGMVKDRPTVPDTGSLRGDMLELLRRSSTARARYAPLFSVLVASYFSEYGRNFADVRELFLRNTGARPATELILERAVTRGEADPARLTPRVKTVAFDLFRHDMLMNLRALEEEQIEAIIDEVFLPLVRPT